MTYNKDYQVFRYIVLFFLPVITVVIVIAVIMVTVITGVMQA